MKTLVFAVAMLINAQAFAAIIEGYCTSSLDSDKLYFPKTEEEVLGRTAWAIKCFPDLYVLAEADGTIIINLYDQGPHLGVPVFGTRTDGMWTIFNAPMDSAGSCDGLDQVRLRAVCPFKN